MATLPTMPDFPEWLPSAAVRHEASELWIKLLTEKDPAKSEEVLRRLISHRLMKRVWKVLYETKRIDLPTKEFRYPACVLNASLAARNRQLAADIRNKVGLKDLREAKFLEAEAAMLERLRDPPADPSWTEQDLAAQRFLRHAYRDYLDLRPVFLSDLKVKSNCYRKVAGVFRQQADTLQSLGAEFDAEEFKALAQEYDKKAADMLPRDGDDPWIITRKPQDFELQPQDVELRSFVIDLSSTATKLFGQELHSTLANVANVVFNRQDVTRSKVRELLRSISRERR
jgi:hypothetical protein